MNAFCSRSASEIDVAWDAWASFSFVAFSPSFRLTTTVRSLMRVLEILSFALLSLAGILDYSSLLRCSTRPANSVNSRAFVDDFSDSLFFVDVDRATKFLRDLAILADDVSMVWRPMSFSDRDTSLCVSM
jgi:hypothetical protein